MWSIIEIFQFITLNIICGFFIYFSIINLLKVKSNTKLKIIYISMLIVNIIWLIFIYTITFIVWKTSWGFNFWLFFSFSLTDILYFIIMIFIDKSILKTLGINKKELSN
ncbi:hypothetical protein SDIMI_v3c02420 [Spiroplasma diminutum CUAS-1]|uniref:Transmembrane protein n=1 Tax=Spiroplasma diminutum CUAS-1 TaxID=1276221 RepID=S5LZD5_9MOLU|nr:hypothetical protein SDIMI_v3c02420 [Spiroplasma diminutum CUAS-1]